MAVVHGSGKGNTFPCTHPLPIWFFKHCQESTTSAEPEVTLGHCQMRFKNKNNSNIFLGYKTFASAWS